MTKMMLQFHRIPLSLSSNLITAGAILPTTLHCIPRFKFRLQTPTMVSTAGNVRGEEDEKECVEGLAALKLNLENEGIRKSILEPGNYKGLICPKCGGGNSERKSFSLFVRKDGQFAAWSCRDKCGWKGTVEAFGEIKSSFASERPKVKAIPLVEIYRVITEEEIELAPLGKEVLQYFSLRGISLETLQRNAVMQKTVDKKVNIAFTYRRNGSLVNCKYRSMNKKEFCQERETERIFYGLDDIKQVTTDIIIVEGEIDKLTMDEIGYTNCVSVPDGAPEKVAAELLTIDEASRIILATDADLPGQALAEEIARRVGKERCWRVKWPDKSATEVYKDANEVCSI